VVGDASLQRKKKTFHAPTNQCAIRSKENPDAGEVFEAVTSVATSDVLTSDLMF